RVGPRVRRRAARRGRRGGLMAKEKSAAELEGDGPPSGGGTELPPFIGGLPEDHAVRNRDPHLQPIIDMYGAAAGPGAAMMTPQYRDGDQFAIAGWSPAEVAELQRELVAA